MESKVVKKFLEKPYALSALGEGRYGEPYYNYLALLHLILVKKGRKQGFVIPGLIRNALKICKKLDLVFKKSDWYFVQSVGEDNPLSVETTEEIKKMTKGRGNSEDILCGIDDKILERFYSGAISNDRLGEFEQYPKCCIKEFTNNVWGDFVQAAEIVGDDPKNVEMILNMQRAADQDERIFQRIKKIQLEDVAGTRINFPYVFHQACSNCLSDAKNSPSAKLNREWSKVAQEFPELNNLIVQGARDEGENKKRLWEKSWQEWVRDGCWG